MQQFANNQHTTSARTFRGWVREQQRIAATLLLSLCIIVLCASGCSGEQAPSPTTNQVTVQQIPKARLTYVAIGASDTFGIGTDDPQTQSWPSDLAGKLGDGVRIVNLGVPGVHAHEALNVELPVALDTHPDLITVWLAVNDLADNVPLDSYTQDFDLILSRLQASAPHARIVVANVPDLTFLPRFQSYDAQALHARIASYNTAIATLVKRHHVVLVDLYVRWQELANHPEYISNDGFHPNAIGYNALAAIFYQVLQENS